MSRLLMIRHAQASYGKKDYDQLSELGYEQSGILGNYLADANVVLDKIYIGPLKRHWQTYETARDQAQAKGQDWPEPIQIEELEEHRGPEILFGLHDQIVEMDDQLKKWKTEMDENPELKRKNGLLIFTKGMEMWASGELDHIHPTKHKNWTNFRASVKKALQQIQQENVEEKGITIAAFTSGGTISAATGHVLGMENEVKIVELNGIVQNTSMTEYLFSKKRITLKSFNQVPHLVKKEHLTYV